MWELALSQKLKTERLTLKGGTQLVAIGEGYPATSCI